MGIDFFRKADWLDAKRARAYALLLAVVNLALLVFLIATSRDGIDRNGFLLGTDFLSFWNAGHMLRHGGSVYDAVAQIAAQRAYFSDPHGYTAFFYPPVFLPFCYPLGFLSYFPALSLWLVLTGAAYHATLRAWFRHTGAGAFSWTYVLAFPPVLLTITHGQTSFLVAALLGLGALLVPNRPLLAGALLGLAVFKPQFGLMVPVVLLFARQWRVIGAALASAAVLCLVTTLAFGFDIWREWLARLGPAKSAMESGVIGYAKMQSLFAGARLIGLSTPVAYALQGLLGLFVAVMLAWASWRGRYGPALAASMLTGGLIVTPFMLDYDLVLTGFALVVLAAAGFGPWEKAIAAAVFIAPVFARPLGLATGIPIMPPLLVALFVLVVRRALAETSISSRGPGEPSLLQ